MWIGLYLNPASGLVVEKLVGTIDAADIEAMLSKLYSFPCYSKCNRILTDCRAATVGFEVSGLHQIETMIRTQAQYEGSIHNAILVDQPTATAYSLLFQRLVGKMDFYNCEVFTTLTAAAMYLSDDEGHLSTILSGGFINSDFTTVAAGTGPLMAVIS